MVNRRDDSQWWTALERRDCRWCWECCRSWDGSVVSVASRPTHPIHSLKLITSYWYNITFLVRLAGANSSGNEDSQFSFSTRKTLKLEPIISTGLAMASPSSNWKNCHVTASRPRLTQGRNWDSPSSLRYKPRQEHNLSTRHNTTIFRPLRLLSSNPSQSPDLLSYLWISMSSWRTMTRETSSSVTSVIQTSLWLDSLSSIK